MHPAKKREEDEKNLCAEGTVTAGSVYETRNCISKRIQEFSPLRKLLTRIRNKSSSVYMPLNWRALLETTLNSAGLCPAKNSSEASELAIPEISIASPASDPSPFCFHFLTLFLLHLLRYLFLPHHFSVLPSPFPYYYSSYLPTLFSFHSYFCLKDQNLAITHLSYCSDKNIHREIANGRRVLVFAALFCFYSCLLHGKCGDCSKRDNSISHYMSGKYLVVLLQSCMEIKQEREKQNRTKNPLQLMELKRNHWELLTAKNAMCERACLLEISLKMSYWRGVWFEPIRVCIYLHIRTVVESSGLTKTSFAHINFSP